MPTAFLFPGQRLKRSAWGGELVANVPAAKSIFDRALKVLGYDIAQVCFEGPAEKLDSTVS